MKHITLDSLLRNLGALPEKYFSGRCVQNFFLKKIKKNGKKLERVPGKKYSGFFRIFFFFPGGVSKKNFEKIFENGFEIFFLETPPGKIKIRSFR